MAFGLKLRNVKRFGQKLQHGVNTFARKLGKTADVIGAIATPIATAIGGPAGAAMVSETVSGVKGVARTAERLTGKGVAKGEKLFKQIQQPVLGVQEIVKGAQQAIKNPQEGQIMIGNAIARRFPQKNKGIQRTDGEMVNEWAPELPFAQG